MDSRTRSRCFAIGTSAIGSTSRHTSALLGVAPTYFTDYQKIMTPAIDVRPIVVADDDTDDLFFACRSLQKAGLGASVLTCTDGSEVVVLLQTLAREKKPLPRTIFLDVKMPKLDGFQTLQWIRAQKSLNKVGVVMLSGSGESRDLELARSLGADDYLVKYPAPAEFSRVVAAAEKRGSGGKLLPG
jgi:two-component system, response regulator